MGRPVNRDPTQVYGAAVEHPAYEIATPRREREVDPMVLKETEHARVEERFRQIPVSFTEILKDYILLEINLKGA